MHVMLNVVTLYMVQLPKMILESQSPTYMYSST
jgi:hypothetical protein